MPLMWLKRVTIGRAQWPFFLPTSSSSSDNEDGDDEEGDEEGVGGITVTVASSPLRYSSNITDPDSARRDSTCLSNSSLSSHFPTPWGEYADAVRVIGQPPRVVEMGDDKAFVNDLLRGKGAFTMPRSWTLEVGDKEWRALLASLPYPVVGKPVRGWGSCGGGGLERVRGEKNRVRP